MKQTTSLGLFAFAVAVFLFFHGPTAASGQEIVTASYTDATCTTIKTNPQSLASGQCVYTTDFKFWYTVFAENNTARYLYGCTEGCAENTCLIKGSATFGTCPTIPISNTSSIHVSAYRILTNSRIGVRVFNDDRCANQITAYGTITLPSGHCQYVSAIQQNLMVSQVDPHDAPVSSQGAYRAGCNSDCSSCAEYGRTAFQHCTQVDLEPNKDSDGDVNLTAWQLALIIVGSVIGGALAAFACSCVAFCAYKATRKHHDYSRINH